MNNFFYAIAAIMTGARLIVCHALISVFFLQQVISASWIFLDSASHCCLSLCCNSYMDPQWLPILGSTSSVYRFCRKSSAFWDKGGLFCLFSLFPAGNIVLLLLLNSESSSIFQLAFTIFDLSIGSVIFSFWHMINLLVFCL